MYVCSQRDSNPGPFTYESRATPLYYALNASKRLKETKLETKAEFRP